MEIHLMPEQIKQTRFFGNSFGVAIYFPLLTQYNLPNTQNIFLEKDWIGVIYGKRMWIH